MQALTFIGGSDDFLVQRRGAEVWAGLREGLTDEFSVEVIDGQAGNSAEVSEAIGRFLGAVQTLSLFGDRKVVWLKGVTFLGDTVTGRAESTQEQVEKMQAALQGLDPSAVSVLITAAPVDRRRRAYKWFQEHANFEFIDAGQDAESLLPLLESEAQRLGVRLEEAGARALVATLHGHPRLALEELRKLATYLGPDGGSIQPQLVAEMVPPFGEGDFFETVEAFFSLDLEHTLDALRRHFFAGHDARPVLVSLQNRNRLLIQLKALSEGRLIPGRVSKQSLEAAGSRFRDHFPDAEKSSFNVFSQNPWYLSRLAEGADRLSLRRLIQFQEAFMDAFVGILERPQEQEEVLREMTLRCLR